ncbi:SMI1/KNR4 family protein [Metabacillus sp. KIGAM252]|uniref:SMI1/KNR4 family protein n=1 Tax=Metabacillus flavus TaxID=2823519 RepID=A0ABS5LJP9_9BACI|nr:SMI1/KNR4 family protein [Metabacillus flavus]MBS2970793.1 SMI1/KNR4 family protein [Metabacillus flavus]
MKKVEWIQPDAPIADKEINLVEQYFGIEFPKDYKECVKKYNGGYPEPDVFKVGEDREEIFLCLLSYTSEESNIVKVYDLGAGSFPSGIFPFARDPFGNKICFDYRESKDSPEIIFLDHELEGEEAIYYVCETFTGLLDRLYKFD